MSDRRWKFMERFDIDDIADPGNVYMTRWYILKTPLFGIYLHKIIRPDHDRELHDHPWNFIPIILKGRYLEELPSGELAYRSTGSVRLMRATDRHRIDTLDGDPVWTLCLVGRKKREWGFYTDDGWMWWGDYIHNKELGYL